MGKAAREGTGVLCPPPQTLLLMFHTALTEEFLLSGGGQGEDSKMYSKGHLKEVGGIFPMPSRGGGGSWMFSEINHYYSLTILLFSN